MLIYSALMPEYFMSSSLGEELISL
ncbi:hypothetical protein THIOSC15_2850006 [uncultured Thiomicrorhabdus sp.]